MFEQVSLPYAMNALEPVIDQATLETHYGKHHAAYTKTLNELAEKAGVTKLSIEELLGSLDQIEDPALRTGIRNNGGGYYNHNLYFETLSPDGRREPQGKLAEQIKADFGSFEDMKTEMSRLAVTQFGSGWSWLSTDGDGKLYLSQSLNQDNPISQGTGRIPLACIDVWEHAYYLKYRNLRAKYVEEIWQLMDWEKVEERYSSVK